MSATGEFNPTTAIGPGCSLVLVAPPCRRCKALIASGRADGTWPLSMIETCAPSECLLCARAWIWLAGMSDCSSVRVCAKHHERAIVGRRVVPLEYDRPQVASLVRRDSEISPRNFFF